MAYLAPTFEQGKALVLRGIEGPVVMLNLLRFRATADYSGAEQLAPASPISGQAAYQRYLDHTEPLLTKAGGRVRFFGSAEAFTIGPEDERWDVAMLVEHQSVDAFLAFAKDETYLAGVGHRAAALEDSRLLPLVEGPPRLS
jgi:uncharacterized protein (DUF1330 family)